MKYNLILKPRAENDLAEAIEWYESKQKGLGQKFLNQIDKYLNQIKRNPLHYPSKRLPFREAYIKKFPYIIIYEVFDLEIVVYAVFCSYQNPSKKP